MAEHVDILKTGAAQPLARVAFEDGRVEIQAEDRRYWRDLLVSIVQIDPDEQPEEFFRSLHEKVDGTYVYATPPHDEGDDCPAPNTPWGAQAYPARA